MIDTPSINKIISIFKDFALRNKMVYDFSYGPTYNIGASRPMKFPYIWVEQGQATSSKGNQGWNTIVTFNVYCMDKIDRSADNFNELVSDTKFILDSMVAEMINHRLYRDYHISIDGDVIFDPVVEGTDDDVNGWQASISLRIPLLYTPCSTPVEPITAYEAVLSESIEYWRLEGPAGPTGATGTSYTPDYISAISTATQSGSLGIDNISYDLTESNSNISIGVDEQTITFTNAGVYDIRLSLRLFIDLYILFKLNGTYINWSTTQLQTINSATGYNTINIAIEVAAGDELLIQRYYGNFADILPVPGFNIGPVSIPPSPSVRLKINKIS